LDLFDFFSWLQTLAEKAEKNVDILSLKNITDPEK
jgi:hypothetical protein